MLRFVLSLMLLAALGSGCERRSAQNEQKKTFRVALRQKVKSLDPAFASDFYAGVAVSRAYEGLYRYSYGKDHSAIEPALAQGLPQVSKDGRQYEIKIKSGVRFHELDRELTAQDVVYSWNRLLDPKLSASGQWTIRDRIEALQAPDDKTVIVRFKEPYPQFVQVMALPAMFIVAKEAVEKYGDDFAFHPVGTGPFLLKAHNSRQFTWEKNPQYHEPGVPRVDLVVDDVVEEDQPTWLSFMKGDHDVLARVPKDKLKEKNFGDKTLLKEPAADFTYFAFNMEDPVVGGLSPERKKLRKAMAMAFDVGPVIEHLYDGYAIKAQFLIAPPIPEYDGSFKNPWGTYDLVKARKLLAEAGFENGQGLPEMSVDAPSDTANRLLAEHFQRNMSELGIKVKLALAPWPELLSRAQRKQGQIYAVSWIYDYPDAESGFQILYGPNSSPGPNKSNYRNPKYDSLFEKFRGMPAGPARAQLIKKMREIFVEDAPWILIVHRLETRLVQPWVKNYQLHLFDYNPERYIEITSK